jgi:hypothetical protein
MKTLRSELIRVTGDESIVVHDGGVVGWLDPATGAGDVYGVYDDPTAVAAELADLPDWDGATVDWSELGIPRFDR